MVPHDLQSCSLIQTAFLPLCVPYGCDPFLFIRCQTIRITLLLRFRRVISPSLLIQVFRD